MTDFIASYDLKETTPSPHAAFLNHAINNGWSPWIKGTDNTNYRLPNTTLQGSFPDRAAAVSALEQARVGAGAELRKQIDVSKWIVAEYTVAEFLSDGTV